jgi:hypothetical protein
VFIFSGAAAADAILTRSCGAPHDAARRAPRGLPRKRKGESMDRKGLARRAALLAVALVSSTGSVFAQDEPKLVGFTCCNLHYNNDWISDANWGQQPMLPAGLPIKITDYGRYRIHVEIDGRKFRIGQDYGRQEPLAALARKIVVEKDPKPKIESWPQPVREAIKAGRVRHGMTKEQVLVAVGYPPVHQTPNLDQQFWKHWYSNFGSYLIEFDDKGRVKDVKADATTRAIVYIEK